MAPDVADLVKKAPGRIFPPAAGGGIPRDCSFRSHANASFPHEVHLPFEDVDYAAGRQPV